VCFFVGFRLGTFRLFAERQAGKNLTVLPHSLATRLLVEAGRAVGVELLRFGRREVYRATREVILSAGGLITQEKRTCRQESLC
jgi:choline dehydrogenase